MFDNFIRWPFDMCQYNLMCFKHINSLAKMLFQLTMFIE